MGAKSLAKNTPNAPEIICSSSNVLEMASLGVRILYANCTKNSESTALTVHGYIEGKAMLQVHSYKNNLSLGVSSR